MKNLIIENVDNEMILRLDKRSFDGDYLVSLVKRLQIEELTYKANLSDNILEEAEKINQDWWDKNREDFLKGIER